MRNRRSRTGLDMLHILLAPTFHWLRSGLLQRAYWSLSLGLTWFTPFVVKGLGFPQSSAGWISALPWDHGAHAR